MKHIIFKTAALGILALGMVSCADDLNISSIDPQSSQSYDANELLAKQYATLALTGQKGGAGNADFNIDEGESGFYRTVFNLEELCTDECIWAWQDNTDIPALTNIAWTASSDRALWAYNRLGYDITLHNQFITEQTGKMDDDVIAEVRFLRALQYYYFLDLFRKAPFTTVFDGQLPVEKAGKDLYDWIDQELTEIEPMLKEVGYYNTSTGFGRADRGAAYALHARLALNSNVYTNGQTQDYQKAIDYCNKIIDSGAYALCTTAQNGYSGYAQLFMGDNDENQQAMKEIIFPVRQDGAKTRQYGGATYLVNSMRIAGMPYMSTANGWSCNFARKELVQKFFPNLDIPMASESARDNFISSKGWNLNADGTVNKTWKADNMSEAQVIEVDDALGCSTAQVMAAAGDTRAMLYMGVGGGIRTLSPGKQITNFLGGASMVKWTNFRLDGSSRHDLSSDGYADCDIPMFRLAEVYLTRAEAEYRLNNINDALRDLVTVQSRSTSNVSTNVTEDILIDEWCKEFYMEGRRRSDLVRFGRFSGSSYLWDFKGGQPGGTGVQSFYDIYPIPSNDLAGNPNMTQNPGY